jgi:uncharacterized membrane protein YhiD involved in acid resistance
VLVAFALTFVLGFERELRGSPAGDRTFSLIGTASAVLGNLAGAGTPNAIAGAVTGIGFIGGGIVFRRTVRSGQMAGLPAAALPSRMPASRCPFRAYLVSGANLIRRELVTVCCRVLR